jgi:hypothetical protein
MTPEALARQNIDRQLAECGWIVQDNVTPNPVTRLGEIEAISILYSRPCSAGLRYGQVKELARRLSIKPFHIDESQPQTLLRLWQAFGTVAPDKVDTGSGKHCKHIVDLVSLVRHAIDPESPLRPIGQAVEERFTEWLSDQQQSGGEFTEEQMQWLVAIKDHIASSLSGLVVRSTAFRRNRAQRNTRYHNSG